MKQSARFSVRQLGKYPATRSLGQDGRVRLDDLLAEREGVDLTIDFAGVEAMNISFADEFLGKFLRSQDFSAKNLTVKVTGLNADNRYSVVVCVERRETQVVVLEDDGSLVLVGDKMLAETFDHALGLGSFKANDLASAMSLTSQNANNRLKRLASVGALRKTQVTGSTRGGKEFVYEALPAEVPDHEQFLTG
jgi:STAS-like domain of unknown function (DUF4325)